MDKNQNARIVVLVHPSDPFDAGWWLQPTVYDSATGNWSAKSWVGNQEFPPEPGYQYDIMAVVADAAIIAQNIKVADPMDLKPQVQTGIIHVAIGKVISSQTSAPITPTEEPPTPVPTEEFVFSPTLYNGQLAKGMQLDVASSGNLSDWVIEENRILRISYPEGQDWGAVADR